MTAQIPNRPFTVSEARSLHHSDRGLRSLVDQGLIRRALRGVYVPTHIEDSLDVRLACARLVTKPHSVICDRTAAWIHGADIFTYAETEILPTIDVLVPRWRNPSHRKELPERTRDLSADDVMTLDGVLITTPLRTAMDLGCQLHPRRALAAVDALMTLHGFTRADMVRQLGRYRGRRGVVQLRRIVAAAEPGPESNRESWARWEVIARGIPAPVVLHWVEIDDVPTYRLDMAWPRSRVALEYDGQEHHTNAIDRLRDQRRRQRLHDLGWTIIVLTKESFSALAIDRWTSELAAALRLAA